MLGEDSVDGKHFGLASSPLDCWLTRRGLATLQLRLERACSNAMSLASRLVSHPMVERVDYPGLSSHPEHEIAKSHSLEFSAT